MTRRHVLAGFLSIALLTAGNLAAQTQGHTREIESLELRFLSTKNAEQRKELVRALKQLSLQSSDGDATALNVAVSAMLPTAATTEEAEELLRIGSANPATPQVTARAAMHDAGFLVDARRVAASARGAKGDVESLADIRIDHLRKDSLGRDGLTSAHIQQVWRVNTAQGVRSFSPRSLMYSSMSETLDVIHARVLKHDGREIAASISADQPIVEHGTAMYFDSRSRDLHFAQLEPGDVIEVEYLLLPATEVNPWGGYFARLDLFSDSYATRLRRRVVVAPSTMKLYAVEHGVRAATVRQNGSETTRTWEARDIPAQPFEALTPGGTASVPYLHVSTIGTMEDFGRWYSSLLEPALKLDDRMLAIAQEINARNLTTQGKVQAVYESVQRSTKYIAFEFGVHSYQPYPVSTVGRRGFGDCKDKAAMIVALLRAVGVPAEFAMVRTRSAGDVAKDAYSVQLFNHAVAYVPSMNLFLDGTAEYAALGELPPDDQGALAVTVDDRGKATRRRVPFSSAESNRVSRNVTAKVDRVGRVEFASQTEFEGYFAAEQRRNSESNDLAGSYRATLAQFYPTVKIAHAVAEGTARASRLVDLRIEGSIDAAQGERDLTLRSSLNTAGLTRKYAPERVRRNPVLVPVTPSEHEVFDYDLPEGVKAELPPNTKLHTAFGKVEVSYLRVGSKLRVETYTELVPLTVKVADYAAFRAFCKSADEALQREVRITLP